MYLLVICSIVSVATILHRSWSLRRDTVIPPRIWAEIESIPPGEHERALARLSRTVKGDPSPLARITEVSLGHLDWPRVSAGGSPDETLARLRGIVPYRFGGPA